MSKVIYVAQPLSDPNDGIVARRQQLGHDCTVALIKRYPSDFVFNPILYSSTLEASITPDPDWYEYDLRFLDRCDMLIVLTMKGHEQSKGVGLEIERAEKLGMSILFISPNQLLKDFSGYSTQP